MRRRRRTRPWKFPGAVWASALLKAAPRGIIPDATQLRVTLYAGEPWLDLEWSIANKTPDPWPEGGWLCFPLRADNPAFRLARLGSIVDPAKDLVRSSNHDLFCLNGGLAVEGADGSRTGICPIDAQLVSLERPGLWHYSRDFVAHKPDVFVSLFNNLYSTNFAQWIDGSWSSRVRLWSIDRRESTPSSLIGNSWEARVACLAAVADGRAGQAAAAGNRAWPSRSRPFHRPTERGSGVTFSRGPLVRPSAPIPMAKGRSCDSGNRPATVAFSRSNCPGNGGLYGAALRFAGPADRRPDHGIRARRVYCQDPVHGPGKLHLV